jgi:polysaccharide deacetylase family protein (PEP-CTERM system associated)
VNDSASKVLDAFCVDLEEWFHVCGVKTPYQDPSSWENAAPHVEEDADTLLQLFDVAGVKATFLTLGWLAEKYPRLIQRISSLGHEIGCHGYYHRLVFEQTPEQFRNEVSTSRKVLQDLSGQAVTCFRAPGFSITTDCYWAYPILTEEGFEIDLSIVPAARDHGGIKSFFGREPFRMETESGDLVIFPVSILRFAGADFPFSGGGYLRLFPMRLVHYGFRQNHKRRLPVMTYVHPREINPSQPRLDLPYVKRFKYYVGLARCQDRIRHLLETYRFGTVSEAIRSYGRRLPKLSLSEDRAELVCTQPLDRVRCRRCPAHPQSNGRRVLNSARWCSQSDDDGD